MKIGSPLLNSKMIGRQKLNLKNIEGHIPELDGLRGFAIALVLLYHLFPFLIFSKMGWSGVDLFFVLSGFLITGILLDTVGDENYWRNFITRRILRIFPLYFFALLLFVFLSISFKSFGSQPVVNYEYFKENQAWYWLYLSNVKVFIEGKWLPTIIFNPLWSLSIEEQFYLVWPLIIFTVTPKKLPFVIGLLIACICIFRIFLFYAGIPGLSIYVFTFTRLDSILIGSLIAGMIRDNNFRKILEDYSVPLFVGCCVVVFLTLAFYRSTSPYQESMLLYGYTFIGLLYGSFLLIVVDRNAKLRLKKIFSSTPLVFLGKYSYSLYIFHWPLYRLLRDPIKELFGQMVWTGQPFAINFLSSSAILILTVLCSLITWNLFEKRFIALKSILVPRTKEVKQSFNS